MWRLAKIIMCNKEIQRKTQSHTNRHTEGEGERTRVRERESSERQSERENAAIEVFFLLKGGEKA